MTIQKKNLGITESEFPASSLRFYPKDVRVVQLAAQSDTDPLPLGMPLMSTGSDGVVDIWSSGASDLVGFLWPCVADPSTAGEVFISVMTRGDFHKDDVVLPDGESQGDLDDALKDSKLAIRGLDVDGYADANL